VPPDDDAAFARVLGEVLASAAAREEMGRAARAHVEATFTPAAAATRTLAVYRELLA